MVKFITGLIINLQYIHIWIIGLFLVIFLFVILWFRRKKEGISPATENENLQISDIPIQKIENPTEQDQQAYEIIRSYRKKIWMRFSLKTQFNIATVNSVSYELIRQIAAVYYPRSLNPELQVTIVDLIDLNQRVIFRLRAVLDRFPLKSLKGIKLGQVIRYKELYDKISGKRLVKLIKNRWVRRITKGMMMAANYANPKYWITRSILKGSKEVTLRYLLASVVTIVGEEAVLLYRKQPGD